MKMNYTFLMLSLGCVIVGCNSPRQISLGCDLDLIELGDGCRELKPTVARSDHGQKELDEGNCESELDELNDCRWFSLEEIDFGQSDISLEYKVSSTGGSPDDMEISSQELADIIAVLRRQEHPKHIDLWLQIVDEAVAQRSLETLATLTNKNFTICLSLIACSNLVDVTALGLMQLEELNLSWCTLRSVRGLERCPLKKLEIIGGELASIADICQLPRLKVLSLDGSSMAEPSRADLQLYFPSIDLLYFKGRDGTRKTHAFFLETERFMSVVKDADRVIVRNLALDIGERNFDSAPVLVTLTDPREIDTFRQLFRFRDRGEFFDCFCAGNPLIEWWRGDTMLARMPVHHMKGLEWEQFYGCAYFTYSAQEELRDWFCAHNVHVQ